jgi:hypothetical protein
MADWKQITARIRRARTGKDPVGQLANLYQKTSDAMVAFELAKLFESSGQNSDAAKWYSTAAAKFRRAEWKNKAQEAAVRLGGSSAEGVAEGPAPSDGEFRLVPPESAPEEKELPFEKNAEALESAVAITSEIQEATKLEASGPPGAGKGPRRRGRRGGRNRKRGPDGSETGAQPSSHSARTRERATRERAESAPPVGQIETPVESEAERVMSGHTVPSLPVEPLGETGPSPKGRYGDPGLSSRISLLEMQFRRLLACPPAKLNEADRAPAGPGVFVLTDSDLTTYYYVEACQTLRIAVGHLIRGGSRRGADVIKPQLAEHLGIPETRVGKYLADHCVVRWLQLDEGASNFAHFAIAVLRPILNE